MMKSADEMHQTFTRNFYERIHLGLYPNLDLLDLRPGTIVKQSHAGHFRVAGTLEQRAHATAKSGSRGANQHIEAILARVKPRARTPDDDFPPIMCNFKSEGVTLGDLTTNERAPICAKLARCHALMKFELAHDVVFSTAEGTTWFALSEPELDEVWRVAEPLLRDDESLVCGVAFCPQFVAYMAGTPGALIGFVCDAHVDPSQCTRVADLFLAHPLEVKLHTGEVLAIDAQDCVGMFAVRPKAPPKYVSPQTV